MLFFPPWHSVGPFLRHSLLASRYFLSLPGSAYRPWAFSDFIFRVLRTFDLAVFPDAYSLFLESFCFSSAVRISAALRANPLQLVPQPSQSQFCRISLKVKHDQYRARSRLVLLKRPRHTSFPLREPAPAPFPFVIGSKYSCLLSLRGFQLPQPPLAKMRGSPSVSETGCISLPRR